MGYGRKGKPKQWVPVDEFGEPKPLDEEQTRKLRERSQNLCLWHLGQGPRTRKQLMDAMIKHGVPTQMAEEVVDKLTEYNYVNDAAFAASFVVSRHELQRKGRMAIRRDLHTKGVSETIINEALEQITEESEAETARVLVERKAPSSRGLDRQKRTQRLVGMLARKGYPAGLAFQVVREVLDAEEPEEEDFSADT